MPFDMPGAGGWGLVAQFPAPLVGAVGVALAGTGMPFDVPGAGEWGLVAQFPVPLVGAVGGALAEPAFMPRPKSASLRRPSFLASGA